MIKRAFPLLLLPVAAAAAPLNSALASPIDLFGSMIGHIGTITSLVAVIAIGIVIFRALVTGDTESVFKVIPLAILGFIMPGVVRFMITMSGGELPDEAESKPDPVQNGPSSFERFGGWVGDHLVALALGVGLVGIAATIAYRVYMRRERRISEGLARQHVRDILKALDIVDNYSAYWLGVSPVYESAKKGRTSRLESLQVAKHDLLQLLEHAHSGTPLDVTSLKGLKRVSNDVEKLALDFSGTRVVQNPFTAVAQDPVPAAPKTSKVSEFFIGKSPSPVPTPNRPDSNATHRINQVHARPASSTAAQSDDAPHNQMVAVEATAIVLSGSQLAPVFERPVREECCLDDTDRTQYSTDNNDGGSSSCNDTSTTYE